MNLVVLTYESYQANAITHRLLLRRGAEVRGIVSSSAPIAGKTRMQAALFLLRRGGLPFALWKLAEGAVCSAAWGWSAALGRAPAVPSLRRMSRECGVPLRASKDINGEETVRLIQNWKPDLVVSIYMNQLIGARLLGIPPKGAINIHGSLLPRHRGLFPYFWALAEGEHRAGATVHWVNASFDTGDILLQRELPGAPADSVSALGWRNALLGAELLMESLELIERGAAGVPQKTGGASYHSWPTFADLRELRRRGGRLGSLLDVWRRVLGRAEIADGADSND